MRVSWCLIEFLFRLSLKACRHCTRLGSVSLTVGTVSRYSNFEHLSAIVKARASQPQRSAHPLTTLVAAAAVVPAPVIDGHLSISRPGPRLAGGATPRLPFASAMSSPVRPLALLAQGRHRSLEVFSPKPLGKHFSAASSSASSVREAVSGLPRISWKYAKLTHPSYKLREHFLSDCYFEG